MPFNFPIISEADEIRLRNAPLQEVICQVKFPVILAIVEHKPADFQERIRHHFPEFTTEPAEFAGAPESVRKGLSVEVKPPVYRLRSRHGEYTASLGPDFFALSARAYSHWPEFAANLEIVASAAQEAYDIPYSSRIGLRYVNLIDARFTKTGTPQELLDLLKPELTAIFRADIVSLPVYGVTHLHWAADEYRFSMRFGMAQDVNTEGYGFVLDFDCYAEGQLELTGLSKRCDRYHQVIYGAFRWCIQDDALAVFRPVNEEA